MFAQLIGYQKIDFTTKQGDRIVGTNLYIASDDDNVRGRRTDKVFCSQKAIDCDLIVNHYYDVCINIRGKVDKVVYLGENNPIEID